MEVILNHILIYIRVMLQEEFKLDAGITSFVVEYYFVIKKEFEVRCILQQVRPVLKNSYAIMFPLLLFLKK